MQTTEELFRLLPSQRTEVLGAAIGRRLLEVERLFLLDVPTFLEDARFTSSDFFSYNSGPVQLHFEGALRHVLSVWPSQLSLVAMKDELHETKYDKLYRLSDCEAAHPALKDCLGRTCEDVRIWTLREDFESEEATEVAVSYLLSGGVELFYCIYLHSDLDSDYLLLGTDVPRKRVKSCASLARGETIEHRR